jgi:hypothetical protein
MEEGCMLLTTRNLGNVLHHIYDFPYDAAIYLPEVIRYEADTRCVVGGGVNDEPAFHQNCLECGFKNWLNVAVVSDTCDDALDKTESGL